MKLTKAILKSLADMPEGWVQRIDGLRCEREIIDASGVWFFLCLWWLELTGRIRSWKKHHSILPSANGLPFYSITPAGRAALEASE